MKKNLDFKCSFGKKLFKFSKKQVLSKIIENWLSQTVQGAKGTNIFWNRIFVLGRTRMKLGCVILLF
jgi:hypothetical protein